MITKAPEVKRGFNTSSAARKAGEKFYERCNGAKGREGQDFHLVQNQWGGWHFEDGGGPAITDKGREALAEGK